MKAKQYKMTEPNGFLNLNFMILNRIVKANTNLKMCNKRKKIESKEVELKEDRNICISDFQSSSQEII